MRRNRDKRVGLGLVVALAYASAFPLALRAADAPTDTAVETMSESVRFSSTDHLILSNAKASEDAPRPSNLFMHENALNAEYSKFNLGIGFSNRLTTDGNKDLNAPFILEKKSAVADLESVKITLGDTHQEFGRGIALALYRDSVFGLDNTVEGAAVQWKPSFLDSTVFAGRINALKAPVAINPIDPLVGNRTIWMGGASAMFKLDADTKLGGHYLMTMYQPNTTSSVDKRTQTIGAIVQRDNVVDGLDAYFEGNTLLSQSVGSTTRDLPAGYGSYGSLVWSPVPWKVKLEGKDYRQFIYEFRRPPTLEEDVVESMNTTNATAARLTVERQIVNSKNSVFASYLYGEDRQVNGQVNHGVVGTKFMGPGRSEFEVKAGYRLIPGKSNMWHYSAKGLVRTFKGQAVELAARKQYQNLELDTTPTKDDRNVFALTYTFSERLGASVGYEYVPSNTIGQGANFVNVGGTFKTGGLTSRAFVGQTSGGTQCSGGVCRQVPPYNGAMLETTYIF